MFKGKIYPKDLPRPLKITRLATKIVAVLGLIFFSSYLIISFASGNPTSLDGLAIDSHDNLYVVDAGNQLVKKFDSQGNSLLSWGSPGSGDGQFGTPLGPNKVAVGPGDVVYVLDTNNQRVQKFDASGKFLTNWGSQEQFSSFGNIAVNKLGQVIVTQKGIAKIDANGNYLGSAFDASTGSVSLSSSANFVVDDTGTLFVLGGESKEIYAVSTDSKLSRTIPLVGLDFTQLFNPQNLAVDHLGNFYSSSQIHNRILKFDRDGNFLTSWKIEDSTDYVTTFSGMVVDSRNKLYVLNKSDEQISVFDSNGQNLHQFTIGWRWFTKNFTFFSLGYFFLNFTLTLLNQYYIKKYNVKMEAVDLRAATQAGRVSQIIGLIAAFFGIIIGFPVVAVSSVISPGSSIWIFDNTIFGSTYLQTMLPICLIMGLNFLVLNMVYQVKKRPTFAGVLEIIAGVILFFVISMPVLKIGAIAIIIAGALALLEANHKQILSEQI